MTVWSGWRTALSCRAVVRQLSRECLLWRFDNKVRGPQAGPIPLKSGKTQRVLLVMMIILETVNDGGFIGVNVR